MLSKALAVAIALILALGAADAWAAKKKRGKRPAAATITRDYDGTPIRGPRQTHGIPDIMVEERGRPARVRPSPHVAPQVNVERPVRVRRGSSTYVPPPDPSPNAPNSPPSRVLLQPPPAPMVPPPIRTYQDRVRDCIHSAPLNTGVGNNPSNTQAYISQCAN